MENDRTSSAPAPEPVDDDDSDLVVVRPRRRPRSGSRAVLAAAAVLAVVGVAAALPWLRSSALGAAEEGDWPGQFTRCGEPVADVVTATGAKLKVRADLGVAMTREFAGNEVRVGFELCPADSRTAASERRGHEAVCAALARVLSRIERYDDGRLTISYILRSDYEETGADENFSEGIVDHIRALEGTVVGARLREQLKEGRDGVLKVSLRASAADVDVSVIAREEGGGGHREAAGFSSTRTREELIEFLRAEIAAQLS